MTRRINTLAFGPIAPRRLLAMLAALALLATVVVLAGGTPADAGAAPDCPAPGGVITVDSNADPGTPSDGNCTLREAIDAAVSGNTINFNATMTITLATSSGTLQLDGAPVDLTIDGGANTIIIQGDGGSDATPPGTFDAFSVTSSADAVLKNLTVQQALIGVRTQTNANLTLDGATIRDNADQGVQASDSTIEVKNSSTLADNANRLNMKNICLN